MWHFGFQDPCGRTVSCTLPCLQKTEVGLASRPGTAVRTSTPLLSAALQRARTAGTNSDTQGVGMCLTLDLSIALCIPTKLREAVCMCA